MWFFSKPRPVDPIPVWTKYDGPMPGELWTLYDDSGDPFPSKKYSPVSILDVREGWVRYDMGKIRRFEMNGNQLSNLLQCIGK
jgi:hypothetical protein